MELINAKIEKSGEEKYIVAEKPKWWIKIEGKRVMFRPTFRYKGGIVRFESSKVDVETARKIAEEINKALDCRVAEIKYFYKKAIILLRMEEVDGKYIL